MGNSGQLSQNYMVMKIRSIELLDLNSIAKIHLAAFPKSALSHLGQEAVRRYYEWQLTGPHDCLAIGAIDEQGRMLGFCSSKNFCIFGYVVNL